jgi:hypothetical protein
MRIVRRQRNEEGATLLLAVIFMVVISLILVALVTLAGNDLLNTSNVITQQTLEYSATAAVNMAIENVQYTDPSLVGGPVPCLPAAAGKQSPASVQPLPGNNPPAPTIWVTCSYGPTTTYGPWNTPGSTAYGVYTRQLLVYACQGGSVTCGTSGTPVVSATVELVDGAACSASAVATCGQGQPGLAGQPNTPGAIVESWQNSTA